jgi:hypothetical protein
MIHKVRNLSWSSSIKEAKMRKDAMQVSGSIMQKILGQNHVFFMLSSI